MMYPFESDIERIRYFMDQSSLDVDDHFYSALDHIVDKLEELEQENEQLQRNITELEGKIDS